jgi:fido (protein-threonine AMPylation protein)
MIEPLPDGAAPVTDQEFKGLIPTFVATRADLNLVEQAGIAAARTWVARSPAAHTVERVLSEQFIRDLHRQMFGRVWRWAGTYRTSESNIGADPARVAVGVRDLVDNALLWVAPGTAWITPELACIRVHHQLVSIHRSPTETAATRVCSPTCWLRASASRPSPGAARTSTPPGQTAPRRLPGRVAVR